MGDKYKAALYESAAAQTTHGTARTWQSWERTGERDPARYLLGGLHQARTRT